MEDMGMYGRYKDMGREMGDRKKGWEERWEIEREMRDEKRWEVEEMGRYGR